MVNMEILERLRTAITQTALLTSQTTIWHQRLGHINEASMKTLRDQPGIGVSLKDPLTPCGTCALGKSAQEKHPKTSNETTITPFKLVFTDLAGPFKTALDGSRYISKFTDHNTRFKAVYLHHTQQRPSVRDINPPGTGLFTSHIPNSLETVVKKHKRTASLFEK